MNRNLLRHCYILEHYKVHHTENPSQCSLNSLQRILHHNHPCPTHKQSCHKPHHNIHRKVCITRTPSFCTSWSRSLHSQKHTLCCCIWCRNTRLQFIPLCKRTFSWVYHSHLLDKYPYLHKIHYHNYTFLCSMGSHNCHHRQWFMWHDIQANIQ